MSAERPRRAGAPPGPVTLRNYVREIKTRLRQCAVRAFASALRTASWKAPPPENSL